MSVRQRRLKADYDSMASVFGAKSRIRILNTVNYPPEKYQIEFLVPSLQKELATGRLRTHNGFIAEIVLTSAYPRMAPQCRMLTPVFHPNIAPHAICIGDHWAAGESLPHLVIRIAEMLTFQSYNVKSPLNGEAARWVEQNADKVPLERFDFSTLLSAGEAAGRAADGTLKAGDVCANCGRREEAGRMRVCINQHTTCQSCALECPICKSLLCLKCSFEKCVVCGRIACHQCIYTCRGCGRPACKEHTGVCAVCGRRYCSDCMVKCSGCAAQVCVEHIATVQVDGQREYLCSNCREKKPPAQ